MRLLFMLDEHVDDTPLPPPSRGDMVSFLSPLMAMSAYQSNSVNIYHARHSLLSFPCSINHRRHD